MRHSKNLGDGKELSLIRRYRDRIVSAHFDENDVFALLAALRPFAAKDTPVYEFANFVAHREKDRGFIRDYLLRTKNILNDLGKVDAVLEIKPVFARDEIAVSINDALGRAGLSGLSESQADQVIVCIMSLLQDVRIVDDKNGQVGRLIFGCTAGELELLGEVRIDCGVDVIFPVLVAPCLCVLCVPEDEKGVRILDGHVEVRVVDGALSFSLDANPA